MQSHRAPSARLHGHPAAIGRAARQRMAPVEAVGRVLAFIDPRAAAFAHLAAEITRHPGLVTLDARRDGLRQIADRVRLTPGVRAVVLITGMPLECTALPGQAAALREIGRALGPHGVLLLHGCMAADTIAEMERLTRIRVVGLADLVRAGASVAGTGDAADSRIVA